MAGELAKLLADLKEPEALKFVEKALEKGVDPAQLFGEAKDGMNVVGQRFGSGEYFIPDLVFSGEILRGIVKRIEPHLKKEDESERLGKVVIGTVAGDIHDIGSKIVGLSGFLTLAFESMKRTVEAIKEAGLRDQVKIMIGGGQIEAQVMGFTGADAYGKDAMEAVKLAKGWIGG
jgi:methanogenic corrinoid protein MtbC1